MNRLTIRTTPMPLPRFKASVSGRLFNDHHAEDEEARRIVEKHAEAIRAMWMSGQTITETARILSRHVGARA